MIPTTRLAPLRALAVVGAVATVGSAARSAHAQISGGTVGGGGQVSNEMRAEYLFRSGEKKFDSGQYAEACADFTESLRLGPKLGTLLNLALCHETIGKTATAWSEFHHGAAWAAQNGQKDRHDFAMQHALALETKLPRVLLQLPAGHAIAAVDVDGEPLPDSRWYLPVFLDPGEHSVTISAPGKERGTVKFRVTSSPTEQLVSVPSLADELPKTPAPPMPASDPDRGRRTAGYVLLATGGASLGVGAIFGLLAISSRDEIGSRCTGNVCTEAGAAAYEEAQSRARIATVTTVLGAVGAGLGTWLVVTSRAPRLPAKVGLAPRADGGAELGIGGSF